MKARKRKIKQTAERNAEKISKIFQKQKEKKRKTAKKITNLPLQK